METESTQKINKIEILKNLISKDLCKKIIYESNIKDYIDINIISNKKINEYFENCIKKIQLKEKLFDQFIIESQSNIETKYHHENLITHLYCAGWICSLFSNKFGLDEEFAFNLGFFHDIGKPWAKKYIDTKKKIISNSKGHSQVGENICYELGLDDKISWCTSNHMCSCCHENNFKTHWEYVSSLQMLSIDHNNKEEIIEYANSLACLMIGDDLGRSGDIEKNIENIINHSNNWLLWFNEYIKKPINFSVKYLSNLHPDNSIIVQMYGHSGFGKSTVSKKLIEILNSNNISWDYAERDKSYYNVYCEKNNIDINNLTENYKNIYKYIEENELKLEVQQNWVEQLNNVLDSDSKVKIIDSVQLLYPRAWDSTLLSLNEDAYSVWKSSIKFGYYGFPLSLYNYEFEAKTGKYELIPRNISDSLTYPILNSELDKNSNFNPEYIDIGYGSMKFLFNSILNYNKYSEIFIPNKQVHLIELLEDINKNNLSSVNIQEHIKNKFPPGIILSNNELSFESNYLMRFFYRDGMQIFNGPSRDYRGETLLFNSETNEYYVGRVSLPVFPDYSCIRKDPILKNLMDKCQKFHIVPKFDGSLFVLSLIKVNTPEYFIIKKLLHLSSSKSWIENELGIWCLGSKGCMFAKNQYISGGVLNRIKTSIISSYNSIENFIDMTSKEVKDNGFYDIYSNISLIFEAIDKEPTDELTVLYEKSFCPFLCWVVYDKIDKKIILPKNILYLNPIAEITEVGTWEEVMEFKNLAHKRLLEGSILDEPEGYVVWLDDSNIGVKLKHDEYYIAHKPYSKKNIEMAKYIEFSSEYSQLRKRLLKFKPKPPIEDLINIEDIILLFDENAEHMKTRKDWALFWKNNYEKIDEIMKLIEIKITNHYLQYKNIFKGKGFNIAMEYFDKKNDFKNYLLKKYIV